MRPTPQLPTLEVYMLGLVDFSEVQQLQRRIVYDLGEQGGAVLILCEHPPTISVGALAAGRISGPMTPRCVPWESRFTGSIVAAAVCFTRPGSSPPISPSHSSQSGSLSANTSTACTKPLYRFSRNLT